MTKGRPPPKKKVPFMITHSRRTGKIILVAFSIGVILLSALMIYSVDFSTKQKEYENNWRMMSCHDMQNDYSDDPQYWKKLTMLDLDCKLP